MFDFFGKNICRMKTDFYLCSGKLDDYTEMVKTKKLMLPFAENEKCANFEYFWVMNKVLKSFNKVYCDEKGAHIYPLCASGGHVQRTRAYDLKRKCSSTIK